MPLSVLIALASHGMRPIAVRCTNCGGSSHVGSLLAAGALAASLLALGVAFRQYALAKRQTTLTEAQARHTQEQLELTRDERAYLAAERARRPAIVAALHLRIADEQMPEPELPHSDGLISVGLGIRNEGDETARHLTINLLFPRWVERLRWTGPQNEGVAGASGHRNAGPAEVLIDADGTEHLAIYLVYEMEHLEYGTGGDLLEAVFLIPPGAPGSLPVRARIDAEGQDEVVTDMLIRIQQPSPEIIPD